MKKTLKITRACGMCAVCVFSAFSTAHAAVSSTDLAILGFHGDLDDAFSWIALNDIAAGETLYFTDSSYSSGSFNNTETLIQLIIPMGGITAGTISTVNFGSIPTAVGSSNSTGYTALLGTAYSGNPLSTPFSTGGDSLLIFQDNDVSNSAGITALWAVNGASTNWGTGGSTSTTVTDLYPGLTNGVNAVAAGAGAGSSDEWDNVRFTYTDNGGVFVGTAEEFRALVADAMNWEGANDATGGNGANWLTGGYNSITIVPEPSSSALLALGGVVGLLRRRR